MKYRIIKREHFSGKDTICRYLVAQYKTNFLSQWKNIEYFYKSDFEDIPGVWTHVCSDLVQARMALNQHKKGIAIFDTLMVKVSDTLIFEE
jgi:hypothetical protein